MNNWIELMNKQEFENAMIELLADRKTKASKIRLINDEIREWVHAIDCCLDQFEKYEIAWYLGNRYSVYHLIVMQSYVDILNDMALQIRYGVLNTVKQ